jgi:hypothetical protein
VFAHADANKNSNLKEGRTRKTPGSQITYPLRTAHLPPNLHHREISCLNNYFHATFVVTKTKN